MNGGLRKQGHGHLAITNVQVQRVSALPAESLMGVEELLDMPTLGEVECEVVDFIIVAGAEGLDARADAVWTILVEFFFEDQTEP